MDMGTVAWFVIGWFAVSLLLSLALGGFLRRVNAAMDENDLAVAESKQKVVRYMRGRKPVILSGKLETVQLRGTRKRSPGSLG